MTKKSRRTAKMRRALFTLSLVLVVAFAAVGGTIAWLTDATPVVTNTFTPSNINVDIAEEGATPGNDGSLSQSFQVVPGVSIAKKPTVTAKADVPYYVFVKVTEANWPYVLDDDNKKTDTAYLTYEIADGWTELENATSEAGVKVYYQALAAGAELDTVSVLKGDTVSVRADLTKEQVATYTGANAPTLTFKAYAMQMQNGDTNFSAADAWEKVKD